MDSRLSSELLYDSEASLRLVDSALEELHLLDIDLDPADLPSLKMEMREVHGGMADLPRIVVQASCEIESLLDHLRDSRDALERTLVCGADRGYETEGESSSLVGADLDPHDGLDRALELVDRMEGEKQGDERGRLHSDLRAVIVGLAGRLDMSDVIDLRVNRALSALRETEGRLSHLALHFDPRRDDDRSLPSLPRSRPAALPAKAGTQVGK